MTYHRCTVTERVRYGKPATFQAQCKACGWVSRKHATEDDADNDANEHTVAMAGES
jgi:hypothetical protein